MYFILGVFWLLQEVLHIPYCFVFTVSTIVLIPTNLYLSIPYFLYIPCNGNSVCVCVNNLFKLFLIVHSIVMVKCPIIRPDCVTCK